MKTLRLFVSATVAMVLVGCNEPFDLRKSVSLPSMPVSLQQSSSESSAPKLGRGILLGTVDDRNSFTIEVVFYEAIGLVCIQHRNLHYSRNCWDVDTAPKKMKELVEKYMEIKEVPFP